VPNITALGAQSFDIGSDGSTHRAEHSRHGISLR
jgi:metal-dependent HD superfamily phosphatase/phosphodiesterase